MFRLNEEIFIGLLTALANGYNHTKCISLINQKCQSQPILINFHPNQYSQKFHCYPFAVKWNGCVGSCNNLNNLPNKACVPNKTEDINLTIFNMIRDINESETFKKHISCKYKCKIDVTKWNSNSDNCRMQY